MLEVITVIVIVGILSAIIAPSFLAMFSRNKVNDALTTLQGALQEAQREAMRKSKACTVYIPDGNQIVSECFVTANSTSVGLTPTTLNGLPAKKLDKVSVMSDLSTSPKSITFSFKGNTSSGGTIVLYSSDGSAQDKKCLVISNGLGIMRSRKYRGSISSPTDIDKQYCNIPLNMPL